MSFGRVDRRTFLEAVAAGAAAAAHASPSGGALVHALPAVSHRRILLKTSFAEPQARAPRLEVGKRRVAGVRGDTAGLFWSFDVPGLEPETPYTLRLTDSAGQPLDSAWTLRTFPDPSSRPGRLRVLVYTCAGGNDALLDGTGTPRALNLERRRRLLRRALTFRPDAVIANGDHVYWDLLSRPAPRWGASAAAEKFAGKFDRSVPALGTPNEAVLLRAAGPQIAPLYGTLFRATPVFFVSDDHDYFDNDDADDNLVTFPPDAFMLALARATRRLYYPEFLPDPNRPAGLLGASAPDAPPETAECFGTLRWGTLAEILMYDCRRGMRLDGASGVFVPRETEQWLRARMADGGLAHVVNVPSTPPGWSAGKWGEWYPDVLDEAGKLGTARAKPYWQPGWAAQHDRLLAASSAMRGRIPLFISGDLHAIGETRILRSGASDFRANPVISLLSGPIGTDKDMWPSAYRGTPPLCPRRLEVDERQRAIEENGFTLLDFTEETITASVFKWNTRLADDSIDRLEPFRTVEMRRA
jgi:hypothetical protein